MLGMHFSLPSIETHGLSHGIGARKSAKSARGERRMRTNMAQEISWLAHGLIDATGVRLKGCGHHVVHEAAESLTHRRFPADAREIESSRMQLATYMNPCMVALRVGPL